MNASIMSKMNLSLHFLTVTLFLRKVANFTETQMDKLRSNTILVLSFKRYSKTPFQHREEASIWKNINARSVCANSLEKNSFFFLVANIIFALNAS